MDRRTRNQTYQMKKKRRRLLLLLVLIGAAAYGMKTVATERDVKIEVGIEKSGYEDLSASGSSSSSSSTASVTVQVPSGQSYRGDLVLVNKDYAMHEDAVRGDIVVLIERDDLRNGIGVRDANIRMSEDVMRQFAAMVEAARAEGVSGFLISSGFRTSEEQEQLYRENGADYALPAGSSEHQLGIALDVGSTAGAMAEAPEGRWLALNAWRFGFVLRYPADKTDVTGIQYEPWHFRYVGLPHSAVMQERGLVLEEYLALLAEQRYVSVSVEGNEYEVFYYPYTEGMEVSVPEGRPFTLSGDNKGGIIVTSGGA